MHKLPLAFLLLMCLCPSACSDPSRTALPWQWIRIATTAQPAARSDASVATAADRVFLFGGRDQQRCLADLWVFGGAGSTWTQLPPSLGPTPRSGAAMVWDDTGKRLILHGGSCHDSFGEVHFFSDLWLYTEADGWNREYLAGGPGERAWHAAVATAGGVIFFGGVAGAEPFHRNDAWLLDLQAMSWKRIATDGGPLMAGRPGMLLARQEERLTVFGRAGLPKAVGTADWSLDLRQDRWSRLATASKSRPGPTYDLLLAHPGSGDWLVLEGPDDQQARWRGWTRDQQAPLAWRQGSVAGGPHTPVGLACAAQSVSAPAWLCFGGAWRDELSDETWRLVSTAANAGGAP